MAALALADGGTVPVSVLIDELWSDESPADPRAALHSLVSRLRRGATPDVVSSGSSGYRLAAGSDLSQARRALLRGRAELAAGRSDEAASLAAAALALWRGEPGADLEDGPVAVELRATAAALRDDLVLLRREAAEAAGDPATVALLAAAALATDPLDEDAARSLMTALAAQGQPGEAVKVFARLRHALVAELGAEPAPDLVALHDRVLAATDPSGSTPAGQQGAPASTRHVALGLRAAPNPLLGRDGDVAAVAAALTRSRLVTVLGAGGLGKTRLAQEVARRLAPSTPLVVVVELAGVRADDDVVLALADALGLAAGQAARLSERLLSGDVHDQVLARLSGTRSLVVLDNCEHVASGAARWASEMLGAVPALRILATSRAPLRVAAEQTYPLAPLSADGTTASGPAAELFRQRARAARPDVRLPDDVVLRLCERLDGLPLAIELAAARVRSLSVEEIEEHLDARFALLRSGDAAAPDRHRTLEAVIEWSWNLLTVAQQALWRRLAILPDGFGVDGAAAVGLLGTGSVIDVLDDVDGLVTQSLLTVADDGGAVRYRMLETVREFGLLRLAAAGEQEAVRDALLDWAGALARRAVAALLGPGQVAAIGELSRDQENLLFALRTAAERDGGGVRARRPDVVLQTFVGLAASWAMRGSEERAAGLAGTALGALTAWPVPAQDLDVVAVAAVLAVGALAVGRVPGAGPGQVRALARLRLLLRRPELGRRARAIVPLALLADRGALASRLAAMRDDPDPVLAFAACVASGQEAENDGRVEQALRDAQAAYERATRIGDVACPAFAAFFVASTAAELGDFVTARAWGERVRRGFSALGAADALRQMDWIELNAALAVGDLETAGALCDRLEAPGQSPDARGGDEMRAVAGIGRGEIAWARGDVESALARYAAAVAAIGEEVGPAAPWGIVFGAARLVRLVGAGRRGEAGEAAAWVSGHTVRMHREWSPMFLDRPVLGTACLAVGVHRAVLGGAEAAELVALAEALGSRQDLAPLRRVPLLREVTGRLGSEALDGARERVAALPRGEVSERALVLLGDISGEDERS